jgi:hypothetical protein
LKKPLLPSVMAAWHVTRQGKKTNGK